MIFYYYLIKVRDSKNFSTLLRLSSSSGEVHSIHGCAYKYFLKNMVKFYIFLSFFNNNEKYRATGFHLILQWQSS